MTVSNIEHARADALATGRSTAAGLVAQAKASGNPDALLDYLHEASAEVAEYRPEFCGAVREVVETLLRSQPAPAAHMR